MFLALWLNVWSSANQNAPGFNVGYYVGLYVMFGLFNVIFMYAEFW